MTELPTWAFLVWAVTFFVGVVAGRYYERHRAHQGVRNA